MGELEGFENPIFGLCAVGLSDKVSEELSGCNNRSFKRWRSDTNPAKRNSWRQVGTPSFKGVRLGRFRLQPVSLVHIIGHA